MLKCCCGWRGINLVPCHDDDTARCPECNVMFHGILAEDAIISSAEDEKTLTTEHPEIVELLKDFIVPSETTDERR